MTEPLTRRSFLSTAGATTFAATLATTASFTAQSYARVKGANDRIGVGIIGAGVIGTAHLNVLNGLKEKNNLAPIAVVDCWKTRAAQGKELVGADHALTEYRKLLDMKEVDYVVVATPEHWHSTMTMDAMDAGKAVYCEKPMTHTIPEAQAVMKKQKETGQPLQIGVQALSDDSYISARDAIRKGVIGKVIQAQIEYVRRYDAKAGPWRTPAEIAAHPTKPADLDWQAWLGSAPKRDWDPHHYFEWRCYSAYSGGICTDLFIHRITRIMRACDLLYPRRVVGMGGIWQWPDGRDLPDNIEMICEYPRGMTVYVLGTMSNRVGIDHLIRGYRGTLFFTPTGWVAKDKDGKVLAEHTKTGGEDQSLHHTNLHNHIRNGEPLNCPIELGMAGVVAVNMANESWRSSQMMGWDKANQKMVPANTLKLSHEPEETL
ncbi:MULTISPECIES: Gfo/Idh/MocA family protein [unclassified Schlesneria]|uniref:Gfo/Idh/MocA family protein n=1 Tax=Schlesneria TaxID=656899 RepID=UPI002EF8AB0A